MTLEFKLPDVGEGIDAGELIEWHVAEGAEVEEDQPLADVETDKAIVTIPCPTTGRIVKLCAAVGEIVPVGAVMAVFEAVAPSQPGAPDGGDGRSTERRGAEPAPAIEAGAGAPAPSAGDGGSTPVADKPAPAQVARKPLASPAVRKLARDLGIDLALVASTGPGGRIVREDIEAIARPPAAEVPAPIRAEVVPLRGVRRTIARRMTEAWRTIPHITDYREVHASELVRVRAALQENAQQAGDERLAEAITITPLLVKIAVDALRQHPYVNASIDLERDEIRLHREYHIGIATAAPDGLMVPVVHHADRKSLAEVAVEITELAATARERRLRPEQLGGGTFTVNNYGGLGIWLGTPIINPPEVANLGVGRMQERAVVADGEIVARPIIALAVAGDHRVLDGHTLGAFVSDVVRLMENPSLLLAGAR
jgi:pyruvate dehydrogenase E2 component (dihydrolipoamide acetyltransferase)